MKKWILGIAFLGLTSLFAFAQPNRKSTVPTMQKTEKNLPYDSVYIDEENENELGSANTRIVHPVFVDSTHVEKKEMGRRRKSTRHSPPHSHSKASTH